MSGLLIGEYQIIDEIGQGGMATVYKAYQPSFDRFVAIKVLPRQLSEDARSLQQFQHEARLIARLEHRSILPVYAYGEYEGTPYIVMRLLEAGSLRRKLSDEGPLSPLEAARLVTQIAEALDYAHAHGVIHRDLKPSNILLDAEGNAYLTDFGIAKMLGAAAQPTGAGVAGTPSYMSPEQCQGKPATPASDIYALGAILFELLTGEPPFEGDSPLAVMYQQVQDDPPPLRDLNPALPPTLDRVVLRAMAKDPSRRHPSALALAADLRRAVDEAARFAAAGARRSGADPAQKEQAARPPGRGSTLLLALIALVLVAGVAALVFFALRPDGLARGPAALPTQTATREPRLTVLPGVDSGGPPNELTQTPNVIVITDTPSAATATLEPTSPIGLPGEGTPSATPPIVGPGLITFTQGSTADAEVVVIDPSGANRRVLTNNSVYDGEPDFSPDGSLIAYESQRDDNTDIYVMSAVGSGVRRVTTGPAPDRHPDWSPDNQWIAYESGEGPDSEVWVVSADGSERRQLTDNGYGDRAPQFSPDGTRITFMTEQRGSWEIAVMSFPDGEIEQVYDCPAPDCRFPTWSPDGQSIAYNSLNDQGQVNDVWVLRVATGESTALVRDGQNGRPVYSGDGQQIFFNRTLDDQTNLYRLDIATGEIVQVTNSDTDDFGPDWGPR